MFGSSDFRSTIITLLFICLILGAFPLLTGCNGEDNSEGTETDGKDQNDIDIIEDKYSTDIFADGKYVCKVIRAEKATAAEKETYDALRDALDSAVGKRPQLTTDFLAAGESYDANEFAIIVGRTGHEESEQLYSEIGFGECRIELVGKKLVVAFSDADAATEAVAQLGAILAECFKDGSLSYNEKMCLTKKSDTIIKHLPSYPDGDIVGIVDGGNSSKTAVISNTTAEAYNAYLQSLDNGGVYEKYCGNRIGDNLYATYTSDSNTVTAIYTPSSQEVRLTIEELASNPLPATTPEAYEVICDSTVTQIGLESAGMQNGMSYIIKLADGSFIVIDGGNVSCVDLFMTNIEALANGEPITIAAWIITHIHNDHAQMFRTLVKDDTLVRKLKVERFIWNRPSEKQMAGIGSGSTEAKEIYEGMLKFEGASIHTAYAGQVFYIRNAKYTVFSTSELLEPFVMTSYNDSSVVGLLEIDGRRLFFPGDSDSTQTGNLVRLYGEELKCDLLQVIHHGHNGGNTEAYKLFDPITVLWPVGMIRYETGTDEYEPLTQWECNEWFYDKASSVENIYVAGSEVVTLVIKDLPSHN